MLENFALAALGLVALFLGGDALVKGAARLASAFGVPALLIGLTIVATGTSMPELLVSLDAAFQGVSDVALGNVIGSNIANIGLILGVAGLIAPIVVQWSLLRREIPIMIAALVLLYLMARDGMIGQAEGLVLCLGFVAFTVFAYLNARREAGEISAELTQFEEEQGIVPKEAINRPFEAGRLLAGVVLLFFGAQWTVSGSVAIARAFNVSDFVIGITLVAVGTSLPELVASIVAAMRKEPDIILGNVIGSNIANVFAIIGVTSLVRPIPVAANIIEIDLPMMVAFGLLPLALVFRRTLSRTLSFAFLALYVAFILFIIAGAAPTI